MKHFWLFLPNQRASHAELDPRAQAHEHRRKVHEPRRRVRRGIGVTVTAAIASVQVQSLWPRFMHAPFKKKKEKRLMHAALTPGSD